MAIVDPVALEVRARSLEALGLNGMRMVLVTINPSPQNTAKLDVYFYNGNQLPGPVPGQPASAIFPISGGHRVRAGNLTGMLAATQIISPGPTVDSVSVIVTPIGDYSTYTLELRSPGIDPVFSEIPFKFRPGCFTTDCAPDWPVPPPPNQDPAIDYLAKDYDSFRHVLITALQQRVAGWTPTSEADLSVVLIDLLSAAGDELSDFQDRVMNEAYLTTARKRVSLARHARLMDYYIYEGNQASALMAVTVASAIVSSGSLPASTLPAQTPFFSGDAISDADAVVFLSGAAQQVYPALDAIDLYTWSDAQPALAAGDTCADLAMCDAATAAGVQQLIASGQLTQLVIQEHLNPLTGLPVDVDRTHRQLVHLIADGSQVLSDPVLPPTDPRQILRVQWNAEDKLLRDYCFTITRASDGLRVPFVSRFHGNLVAVTQGQLQAVTFKPPGAVLAGPDELYYELTDPPSGRWGTLCALPADAPLLYRYTAPRGETPTLSTLAVAIYDPDTGTLDEGWTEVSSLVHSDDSAQVYAVETDELGRSYLRFGNGVNGALLPEGAEVQCTYQSGSGIDGNVGADVIASSGAVTSCWNVFDVTDGAGPEPPEQVVRNAPEAFRARQLRAVTLADYVARAEELPGVKRAAAQYMWTGSWRTVRVTIDPFGTDVLSDELRQQVAGWLEAVRLLGEDLEVRPPELVPIVITVCLCASADTWPEDLRFILAQEFSTGFAPDGRMAFFNPDAWTFGQALHRSQVEGRLQQVPGVEHVIAVNMQRFDAPTPGDGRHIAVGPSEIIEVQNDPDHMELGSIDFVISGGRQ